MISKIISPGDRIELKKPEKLVEKEDDTEKKTHIKPYVSQVYDILDDEQLKIAMPMVEGRVIPLPLHARYDMCFFTSGGLYQAKGVITDRYKEDGLYILVVELTSELKKFQRRQYFRLEYTMDIIYKAIDEKELVEAVANIESSDEVEDDEFNKGIVLDISGGGLRFTSNQELERNSIIIIKIDMGGESENIFLANIINSKKVQNRESVYEHRAEFRNMQNATREHLIKFIFDTERKLRKR